MIQLVEDKIKVYPMCGIKLKKATPSARMRQIIKEVKKSSSTTDSLPIY